MLSLIAVDTLREIARFACSDPAGASVLEVGSASTADLGLDGVVGCVARFRLHEGEWWCERSGAAATPVVEGYAMQLGVWMLFVFVSDERSGPTTPRSLERLADRDGASAALVDLREGRRLAIRGPVPAIVGSADCCRLRLSPGAPGILAIAVARRDRGVDLQPIPSRQLFRNDALVAARIQLAHGDVLTSGDGVALRFDDPSELVDRLLAPAAVREAGPLEPQPDLRARVDRVCERVASLIAPDEAALWLTAVMALVLFALVFWSRF